MKKKFKIFAPLAAIVFMMLFAFNVNANPTDVVAKGKITALLDTSPQIIATNVDAVALLPDQNQNSNMSLVANLNSPASEVNIQQTGMEDGNLPGISVMGLNSLGDVQNDLQVINRSDNQDFESDVALKEDVNISPSVAINTSTLANKHSIALNDDGSSGTNVVANNLKSTTAIADTVEIDSGQQNSSSLNKTAGTLRLSDQQLK